MSEHAEDSRAALEALVGTVLADRYRLDSLIGEGGMGAVFKGHHILLKRDVAIKVLHPDIKPGSENARRFEREAQSAARLNHPNCIQVSEFGETPGGMKYMVMQLLEGTELRETYSTALPPGRAVELVLQIVAGLDHAHTHGVIHRDLKPQNIFVTTGHDGQEELKIVDFGIAKMTDEGDGHTKTKVGLVFGTPLYMSPEQALGMDVDGRSDLYSVGVILYEMLAGRLPFTSVDPVALIRMQVSAPPPPLPDRVPPELAAIVYRLLAKERDERFPDAHTVRKVLRRFLESYRSRVADDDVFIPDDEPIPGISAAPTVAPGAIERGTIAAGLGGALQPRETTIFDTIAYPGRRRWPWLIGLVVIGVGGYFGVRELDSRGIIDLSAILDRGEAVVDAATTSAPPETGETDAADAAAPSDEELSELDRQIVARDHDEAMKLLKPLRERYPESADLLWREARLESARKGQREAALDLYVEALQRDPGLAANLGFFAELDKILRHRSLREKAIAVALDHLGDRGHDLLLQFVNDERTIPPYGLRHRALDALAGNEALRGEIDQRANLLRDLDQFADTTRPCGHFMQLLIAVNRGIESGVVDVEFRERLADDKLKLPTLPAEGEPESGEAEACAQVAEAHEATLAALREKFPEKKKRRPTKKKTKKKRRSR